MYIGNLKIALDDDGATYYGIESVYDLIPDLTYNWATPKSSYVNIFGANGSIDLTEAFGETVYNDREVKLRLTTKSDIVSSSESVIQYFANDYSGRNVRINVGDEFFFRGRLTIASDDHKHKLRQIVCNIVADPLKYELDYHQFTYNDWESHPSEWTDYAHTSGGMNVTSSGFSNSSMTGGYTTTIPLSLNANTIYRFYVSNKNNCLVRLMRRVSASGAATEITGKIFASKATETYFLEVTSINSGAVSADVYATSIRPTIKTITGESVPLQIKNTVSFADSYTGSKSVWVFINERKFVIPTSQDFAEYPSMILDKGENRIVVYVPSASFTPSAISGGGVEFKWREGEL